MQSTILEINPQENTWDQIKIKEKLIGSYSLEKGAHNFSLMTAGYRDHLYPDEAANPNVVINFVTFAILGEAKVSVFKRKYEPDAHIESVRDSETLYLRVRAPALYSNRWS